jgi:Domain of unknown function (DUF5076)
MAFVSNHPIYDALPISNDVLDTGGVELLRAAVVDEKLFVAVRRDVFTGHYVWGFVLADIARRLGSLFAADGQKTEAQVTTDIAAEFARSFRGLGADGARYPSQRTRKGKEAAEPATSMPSPAKPQVQSRAKSKPATKATARRKGAAPKR